MSGVNKAIIVGRLGQDPELKYTPNGAAVCNMSIATSEQWVDKQTGQKQEKTEWHRIIIWGKMAEVANQYLQKGSQVYIEGRIETRSWEDQNGIKRYTTEIIANQMQFLGSSQGGNRQQQQQQQPQQPQQQQQAPGAQFTNDDIPF